MKLLIVAALCALSAAFQFDSTLDRVWTTYKAQHDKNYDDTEDSFRRTIFENNVQVIHRHNLEQDLGMHSYRLGLNHYADMTPEEFRQRLGYKQSMTRPRPVATFLPPSFVTDYPASVDWRDKGYVTPVKDQGQCGSCWAFSATGSLEGQHFKKFSKLVSLSEQQLVDCSTGEGNFGCGGGLMDYAFQYVKDVSDKKGFLDTEDCYAYKARDMKCKVNTTEACDGTMGTGFVDVKQGSEADLLAAVATVGPISVAIDAGHSSFQLYKSGVYDEPRCSSTQLDHGVLAVGYGTQNGKDFWIVKNSWGTSWGTKGYILMSRNKKNQCGIATAASYPLM